MLIALTDNLQSRLSQKKINVTINIILGYCSYNMLMRILSPISLISLFQLLLIFLMQGINTEMSIINTLNDNPLFNFYSIFSFSNPNAYYLFYIFLWLVIPAFDPAIFQRIAMSKDTNQASLSFAVAAIFCCLLGAIISWSGILILTLYPNLTACLECSALSY